MDIEDGEVLNIKGIVLCGTADLPAKARFLNMTNHNACYGCTKCKLRSQNIRRGLNVYPYSEDLNKRTTEETLIFAQEAMELPLANGQRQDVFGVKGPSELSQFVYQYVRTAAVDIMHCAYINLTKSLLVFWFDQKHNGRDFSLFAHKNLVNQRLSHITPPSFVQRLTRTLDEVKYWKAHEMKVFLFYYSLAVIHDIIPELYFEHHKLLVLGLYLLNQRSISENMIVLASQLLNEYVSQFEVLYGLEHMTCNLHQLLHLSDVVLDLGPLWVSSCFPFEDLNGKLKKLVKGTRYAELQVCSGVSMLMKLSELKVNIPEQGQVSKFCVKMFESNRGRKETNIGHRLAIIGKVTKKIEIPEFVQDALNRSHAEGKNFYEFHRLLKYSLVYTCKQYARVVKTRSYCVKYLHNGTEGVGFIDRFMRVTNCNCINFCVDCNPSYLAIIEECQVTEDLTAWEGADLSFIHTYHDPGFHIAVDVKQLLAMCFVIEVSGTNNTFIVEPVNLIEAE